MAGTDVVVEEKIKIAEPKRWKVIFLNDDSTPIDFVMAVLIGTFKHDIDSATKITMQVHETGTGVAGVYTYEIAESKSVETVAVARSNDFPLQVTIEEE